MLCIDTFEESGVHMTPISRFVKMFALTLTLMMGAWAFTTSPAAAQSVCKGLSKSACERNDSCSHVGAFTRSDGVKVKAFCRAKPGKSAAKSTKKKTAKKSTTKKTAAKKPSTKAKKTAAKSSDTKKAKKTTKKKSTKKTVKVETEKPKAKKSTKTAKKTTKPKKKTTKKKTTKKKKKVAAGSS